MMAPDWLSAGGDLTAITTATTDQLTITDGTGPIPNLDIVTGAVANNGVALATGDQIYDFVTVGINNSYSKYYRSYKCTGCCH